MVFDMFTPNELLLVSFKVEIKKDYFLVKATGINILNVLDRQFSFLLSKDLSMAQCMFQTKIEEFFVSCFTVDRCHLRREGSEKQGRLKVKFSPVHEGNRSNTSMLLYILLYDQKKGLHY